MKASKKNRIFKRRAALGGATFAEFAFGGAVALVNRDESDDTAAQTQRDTEIEGRVLAIWDQVRYLRAPT